MTVTNKQWADAARATLEEKWSGMKERCGTCALCETAKGHVLLRTTCATCHVVSLLPTPTVCATCPVVRVFGDSCGGHGGPLHEGPTDMDLIRTCLALIIAIYETGGMEV